MRRLSISRPIKNTLIRAYQTINLQKFTVMYNSNTLSQSCQLLQAAAELAQYGRLTDTSNLNFDSLISFIMALPNNMSIDIAKSCQSRWFDDYSQDIFNALSRELNYNTINV
jgi:hypothetical protein